jgi:hypothetical protein
MQLTSTVTREDIVAFFDYIALYDPARKRMLRQNRIFICLSYGLLCALSFLVVFARLRGSVPFNMSIGAAAIAVAGALLIGFSFQ